GSVGTLAAPQEADTAGQRSIDTRSQDVWESNPDMRHGTERRAGAFQVGSFRHAMAVHLRRIEVLQETGSPAALVGTETTVGVLPAQNELGRLPQAFRRNAFGGRRLQ